MTDEEQLMFLKVLVASSGNEKADAVKQYVMDLMGLRPSPKTAMIVSEALDEIALMSNLPMFSTLYL